MLVGRRDVAEDGIQGEQVRIEQVGHVGQEDRHVLGPALVDGAPGIGADEQGEVPEVAGHLRGQVRAGPFDVQVDDPDVLELGRPGHEGVEQHAGRRRSALDVHLVV